MPTAAEPHQPDQATPRGQKREPAIFARYLNTSESPIEKWETGTKHAAE
jgi:hypothetical protein